MTFRVMYDVVESTSAWAKRDRFHYEALPPAVSKNEIEQELPQAVTSRKLKNLKKSGTAKLFFSVYILPAKCFSIRIQGYFPVQKNATVPFKPLAGSEV